MIKFYFFIFIFVLFHGFGFSQEKADTLDLNYKYQAQKINPMVFDLQFFNIYYPLSGDFSVKNQMNNMIFNELENVSKYQSFTYASNNFYQFYSNGYHFWQNSTPLEIGASIHFNEVFGWDKLDVFMDAQGGLYNVYDIESDIFVPTNQRAFSWNAGVGVGYKVSKGSTIFIKSSVSFDNLSPKGNRNLGGMHMKF